MIDVSNKQDPILVGTFMINGYYQRKIWKHLETKVLLITDRFGITPPEVGDNTFCSLDDIQDYYRSKYFDINIDVYTYGLHTPLLQASND